MKFASSTRATEDKPRGKRVVAKSPFEGYGIDYTRLGTDSENVSFIRLSVYDVQKTDSFRGISVIGI